jgi:hypothetical protein
VRAATIRALLQHLFIGEGFRIVQRGHDRLVPISSTTIMAVSWSSGWLMVTIWPSFISCLMTSEALMAILWASSPP